MLRTPKRKSGGIFGWTISAGGAEGERNAAVRSKRKNNMDEATSDCAKELNKTIIIDNSGDMEDKSRQNKARSETKIDKEAKTLSTENEKVREEEAEIEEGEIVDITSEVGMDIEHGIDLVNAEREESQKSESDLERRRHNRKKPVAA
ncbi:hypothetical protein PV327_007447 [Microctonus hyperodae]|uniref:Uncharacterized protein n=1 Tax=Microctonus hyperodae TaxID=165561 RepID=A0AA39KYL6_MICHY|nr:hypothetical protein PV327_007447 [Microctonus hyperodae]